MNNFLKWNNDNGGVYKLPEWNKTEVHDEYHDYYEGKPFHKQNSKNNTSSKSDSKGSGTGGFLDLLGAGGDDTHTTDEPEVRICIPPQATVTNVFILSLYNTQLKMCCHSKLVCV